MKRNLNDEFRNGGDIVESREEGHDLVSDMLLVGKRHDILKRDLAMMGIGENGDEPSNHDLGITEE